MDTACVQWKLPLDTSQTLYKLSYFTILKFTLSSIPYYFTTNLTFQTLFFLPFYLNILFIFLFFFTLSLSLSYCNQQPQPISNTRKKPTTSTLIKPTTTINHHPRPKHQQNPLANKPNTTHTHDQNLALISQLVPR